MNSRRSCIVCKRFNEIIENKGGTAGLALKDFLRADLNIEFPPQINFDTFTYYAISVSWDRLNHPNPIQADAEKCYMMMCEWLDKDPFCNAVIHAHKLLRFEDLFPGERITKLKKDKEIIAAYNKVNDDLIQPGGITAMHRKIAALIVGGLEIYDPMMNGDLRLVKLFPKPNPALARDLNEMLIVEGDPLAIYNKEPAAKVLEM